MLHETAETNTQIVQVEKVKVENSHKAHTHNHITIIWMAIQQNFITTDSNKMHIWLRQTFFWFQLISLCDNMVRADSISVDFHQLQTSFPVSTLQTVLDIMD